MSKNHPNDNIYSILAKLEALKPTPEEKRFALVKEIRESVEAKGSVLEGVSSVEQKLMEKYMGFDKTVAAIKKGGSAKNPEAVAAAIGRKKYGKAKFQKAAAAGKKLGEESVEEAKDKIPGLAGKHNVKYGVFVVGHNNGRPVKTFDNKADAQAYADKGIRVGNSLNQGSVQTMVSEEYNREEDVKNVAREYMQANGIQSVHDLEPEDIEYIGGECQCNYEGVCEILGCELPDSLGPVDSFDDEGDLEEKAPPGAKAERMVKHIKQGYAKDGKLTDKEKAIAYATTWAAHNKGQVEEAGAVCSECGMNEGECEHTMAEGEITRKHGVTRHTKTDYPGYPSDDLEKDDDDRTGPKSIGGRGRPRKASTVNPRPVVGAEKKGRGRPASVKASGPVSMPADPFGRVSGAVPKGAKGKVHSMGEAMDLLGKQLGQLNEGRYLEDGAGETLNHVLNRFRAEVKAFEKGADLDNDLYDALFDYYSESGDMPYGIQKARTGDPYEWIAQRLDTELGDVAYGKDPANAEGFGLKDEAIGDPQPGIPGNVPLDDKMDRLNKPRDYYEEEVTMEDELNELARLAGIHSEGNAFTGKLKDTPKGGEFELDGKKFKDTSTLDEGHCPTCDCKPCKCNEGNAFGKAVRDAKADGIQPGEKVKVGGEEYPVKESFEQPSTPEFSLNTSIDSEGRKTVSVNAEGHQAEALLQMLKMAGMGGSDKAQQLQATTQSFDSEPVEIEVLGGDEEGCEVDEAEVAVDHPATQPANAPDEQYSTMRGSTMGPGEGDGGEKAMNPDRPTFKNGDNALSNPPARGKEVLKAVAALESKLAAEYESIKKISK